MSTRRKLFDAIACGLGAWLLVSAPLFMTGEVLAGIFGVVFLGAAMMIFAIWGETLYKNAAPEAINLVLAALAFGSPWALGFEHLTAAAWNIWLVAAAVGISELIAMPWETMGSGHRKMA